MPDPVGATCWSSDSGCGFAHRSKSIHCVDGHKPEVNEVWNLGEDSVTPKVHCIAKVDINAGFVCKFSTNYLTENGFKTSIFFKNSINGIFEFLGVPDPLRTNGPYWIDNILVPIKSWGVGGTLKNLNWGSRPGVRCDSVSVPWRGAVPSHPAYLPRIPENMCTTARRVRDNIL